MQDQSVLVERITVSHSTPREYNSTGVDAIGGESFVSWTLKAQGDVPMTLNEAKVVSLIGLRAVTELTMAEGVTRGRYDRASVQTLIKGYQAEIDPLLRALKDRAGWKENGDTPQVQLSAERTPEIKKDISPVKPLPEQSSSQQEDGPPPGLGQVVDAGSLLNGEEAK